MSTPRAIDILLEECKKYGPLTPEGLALLVHNVATQYAKAHVEEALKEAAKRTIEIHHSIADLDQECNDYEESVTKYIKGSYSEEKFK
jgi:23S rRNA maturation-related 3'-5' exoribonuclease YhaM